MPTTPPPASPGHDAEAPPLSGSRSTLAHLRASLGREAPPLLAGRARTAELPVVGLPRLADAARSPWAMPEAHGALATACAPAPPAESAEPEEAPGPSLPRSDLAPRAAHRPPGVELVWFSSPSASRIRKAFAATLRDLEVEPIEALDRQAEKDGRLDVHDVLLAVPPLDDQGLLAALRGAIDGAGRFAPPLVVTGGELRFAFSEAERLSAILDLSGAFGIADKRFRTTLDEARRAATPPAIEAAILRVREALAALGNPRVVAFVDDAAERVVAQARAYQRRSVFGETHVRCLLGVGGATVPTFFPDAVAASLPMAARLPVRLLAEVHLCQDDADPSPIALRLLAFGRVIDVGAFDRPPA